MHKKNVIYLRAVKSNFEGYVRDRVVVPIASAKTRKHSNG